MLNPLLFSLAGLAPMPKTQKPEKSLADLILSPKEKAEESVFQQPDEVASFAGGGLTTQHPMGEPEFRSEGGLGNRYIQGRGDGTSDEIPAMVANNEFVLPADIVSSLGNGSSEAGASVLDQFVKEIRKHKPSNPPSELPPESPGPLAYLSKALTKGKR